MFYKWLFRPVLMSLEPERAHELGIQLVTSPMLRQFLNVNQAIHRISDSRLETQLCGIPLSNPIGLAAGFDKNAQMFGHLHQLGFGFVEVGTVTAHAQPGNEKPRIFRILKDQALINRMGFNNDGVEIIASRIARGKAEIPIGGNIGKSKVTPLDQAIEDYEQSFQLLKPLVDYFVINVSSPNTPGLCKLQAREPLSNLIQHLMGLNREPSVPILLKIAPDLNEHQLDDIVAVVAETKLHGVIATNTTICRDGLSASVDKINEIGAGGLSGQPLRGRSTEVIRFLRKRLPRHVDLVGVGGVFSGSDAYEKIRAGACCVQIYTGLVDRGPNSAFKISKELAALLKRDGFDSVQAAIGYE